MIKPLNLASNILLLVLELFKYAECCLLSTFMEGKHDKDRQAEKNNILLALAATYYATTQQSCIRLWRF